MLLLQLKIQHQFLNEAFLRSEGDRCLDNTALIALVTSSFLLDWERR